MALHLRKSVMRSAVINTVIVLSVGVTSVWFSDRAHLNRLYVMVLLVVAIALGAATGWLKMRRMVQSVLRSIPKSVMYARLQREQVGQAALAELAGQAGLAGFAINWHELNDYAAQLEALDFRHMGDFTNFPLAKSLVGVAVVYADKSGATLVEIQFIQLSKAAHLNGSKANGIHFSIFTLLGGHIRITTTDHTPGASNYLLRSNADVLAAYPGQKLMFLMDRHLRLVQALAERTSKTPTLGLTMSRYVMLQRECHFWVRSRLSGMGGYRFIHEFDRFEANPAHHWAPPSKALASLPVRDVEAIDELQVMFPQPAIVELASLPTAQANKSHIKPPEPESESESETAQLQQTVNRAARWFYWIAALSLVNLLASLWGSQWSFALGLGLSQLLSDGGRQLYSAGGSGAAVFVMYAGCLGSMAFFCACGWFARKPSVFVFMVGIVFFTLDTLIFVFAKDILGVAIHLVVLYFLRQGVPAARILRGVGGK